MKSEQSTKVWWRWLIVAASALAVALIPIPEGITRQSWILLTIFIATIVGSIVQPMTGSAVVLLGVIATALFGALKIETALGGYADEQPVASNASRSGRAQNRRVEIVLTRLHGAANPSQGGDTP